MITRLASLIVKEFLALLRDPKGRTIIIVPPLAQLIVFSYAATLEVKNADVVIWNQDTGRASRDVIAHIQSSPTFRHVTMVQRPAELQHAIDYRHAVAAIEFGPTFSRDLAAGRPATVQLILDGRRSNTAQIVAGYLNEIFRRHAQSLATNPPAIEVIPRNWFNANLNFQWFIVPNLVGSIALLIGMVVTALSIARERELGTFDQIMVSPLRTHEILLGKLIPPLLIGLSHITLFILAAVWIFGVPLRGSLILLYAAAVVYLAALTGLGLLISSLSQTQQQAILGAFLIMVPAILLSGFATPIENMPTWLQHATSINPLRYFLVIVKGVFLKDIPARDVLHNTLPLAVIAVVTLTTASWMFRRRME